MKKSSIVFCTLTSILVLAFALPLTVTAQEKTVQADQDATYQVNFTIEEIEKEKIINTRSYHCLITVGNSCRIRTVNKIPYQQRFLEAGLNIDARLLIQKAGLVLITGVEISTFSTQKKESNSGTSPILREIQGSATMVVRTGKKVVVNLIDDVTSNKRFKVSVLITKKD